MANAPELASQTTWQKLRQARVARLATVDASHRPHLVPVCFATDGSVLYTALDRKPKRVKPEKLARVRNIKSNPQVALLVDHYNENWNRLWYILVRGKAKLLPGSAAAERKRAIGLLRKKYPQYARGMLPEDAPILRIHPMQITSWAFKPPASG